MKRIPMIAACTALLCACGVGMRTPEMVLEEQLQAFHGHLLWGRFEEASSFVAEGERERFLGMYDELGDDYDVTEFDMQSVEVAPGGDSAVVEVWVQAFQLPSTRVEERVYREHWEFDRDARMWRMVDREEVD